MLWNFSDTVRKVKINLNNMPKDMRIRHFVLDAMGGGLDENQRLRPDPFIYLKKGSREITLTLEPWGLHYWSFE